MYFIPFMAKLNFQNSIYFKTLNVLTGNFDQFNTSLLNKSINFYL